MIKKHLEILGHNVVDRVTGFSGVATSISFDLYGCIQVVINPGLKKDGGLGEQCWFDINRLKVIGKKPVMEVPNFEIGDIADGRHGAAEKPL